MEPGDLIRRQREEMGMSQANLSEASAVSRALLSQIENGQVQHLSVSVLSRLAGALQVDPYMLLKEGSSEDERNGEEQDWPATMYAVDIDLLAFLQNLPRRQQRELFGLIRALQKFTASKV